MSTKPRVVIFDTETVEIQADGSKIASTEFYRPNFRADSVAVCYREGQEIKVEFAQGEDDIRTLLKRFEGWQMVAHNIQFDWGVLRCRFPDVNLTMHADTMRLVQVYDNSGNPETDFVILEPDGARDPDDDQEMEKEWLLGFGLVNSVRRILKLPDHKKEAYEWLQANGVKKGQEGANLHKLPADIFQRYNEGDVISTLKLYEHIEAEFTLLDYNWQFDHQLFLSSVSHTIDAKVRGVRVDREKLAPYAAEVEQEIQQISDDFASRFAEPIKEVERFKLLDQIRGRKTLRGRKKFLARIRSDADYFAEHIKFNTGSNNQLAKLFVDVLKIEPKFFTPKGGPSFKSSMLGQWGEGGEMLAKRRKRLIVFKQASNLLALSAADGRFHIDLKMVGTKTGRAAGGSNA